MENISKALIMVGEFLIGILIFSLASFIIVQFGNFSKEVNSEISQAEIRNFNTNFTNFSYRIDISAQEVASIINFAKKNNQKYGVENSREDAYFVDVKIDDTSVIDENTNEFLMENQNNIYYSCNIETKNYIINNDYRQIIVLARVLNSDLEINEGTARIKSINFHSIGNTTEKQKEYANAILQKYNTYIKEIWFFL